MVTFFHRCAIYSQELEEDAMTDEKLNKRACGRFRVPGATVRTMRKKTLFRKAAYGPESSPLLDLSRGGVRFLTSAKLPLDAPVTIEMTIPGEDTPLVVLGHVRWFAPHPDPIFKYQFGVQIDPYGDKEGYNPPEILDRIIALEQTSAVESEVQEVAT
jgi:PilZ domain